MEIELRKLSELVPYPRNPRSISKEAYADLKRKISAWGQLGALLIDGRDRRTILGGNHAYEAMRDLGLSEAKVEYRTPKSDAEALELVILHNERFATWVGQDLAELLNEYRSQIDLSAYTIDLSKPTSADKVLARYGETEEDDFDGTVPDDPESKMGEVYQLGRHRLMCGDSTNPEHVKALMNGQKADVIVTDPPPYGISYTGNPTGKKWTMIANDDKTGSELMDFLYAAFSAIAPHTIDNCPAYVYHAASTQPEFMSALKEAGFSFREQIIWHKNMVLGMSHYHWTHEPVIYAVKGKSTNTPPFYGDRTDKTVIQTLEYADFEKLTKEGMVKIFQALKSRASVFYASQRGQEYEHPTQKPVAAMAPFIKNSSRPDEIVVDLFTGSGTTLVAAHQLDRVANCMEFSAGYCDVIRRRYAKLLGQESQWMEITQAVDSVVI